MLNDAIEYPNRGQHARSNLLVGGVLNMFVLFLLPVIPLLGFTVRVMQSTVRGERSPPAFDDWEVILLDGVVASVVLAGLSLVPLVAAIAVALLLGVGRSVFLQGSTDPGLVLFGALASLFVPVLVGFVCSLLVSYLGVALIANYASRGSPAALLDVGTIATVVTDLAYLKAWVLAVVLVLAPSLLSTGVTTALGFALGLIPIVGTVIHLLLVTPAAWIVTSIAIFYASVAGARAVATGFAAAVDREAGPSSARVEATAPDP